MRRLHLTWLLLGMLLAAAGPALADEPSRTIGVTGEGKATAPPDMATIQTGVVTQAPTASRALAANTEAMERIMAVLKRQNVASKDIQTSSFHVQPNYRRDVRGRTLREIVGYQVTNQLRVRVRNLPTLGEVLDALVQAGSNQVSRIAFGIDNPTGVLNQARSRAVGDARSRAQLYAQAAGVKLGKVLRINEGTAQLPRPEFLGRQMAMQQAAAVPIATGEQEIQVRLGIVFALNDKR